MTPDIHDAGFDEHTKVKLELFETYLRNALPIFLNQFQNLVIADLFAGPGEDKDGNDGSPKIIVSALKYHSANRAKSQTKITVFLNDIDAQDASTLRAKVASWQVELPDVNFIIENKDAAEVFPAVARVIGGRNIVSLVFLDQYGVNFVTRERFRRLVATERCDLIFFVASSAVKRFPDLFGPLFDITADQIKNTDHAQIHNLICDSYTAKLPAGTEAYISGFTIDKGKSVYGLVFMSHHLAGLAKFVEACWKADPEEGTSSAGRAAGPDLNLDLFAQTEVEPENVRQFRKDLKQLVLDRRDLTEKDLVKFTFTRGMLGRHARPVVDELRSKGFICQVAFSVATVLARDPTYIRKEPPNGQVKN